MKINKINVFNSNINFAQNKVENNKAKDNNTTTQTQFVASPIAAQAIKAKNAPATNNYTFLENINIPSLNTNGNLYILPNGQKCLVAKREGPCVLKTFFKVGSMNEPDNLRGISHYIEHNLFNGSKNLAPTEFVENVNKMGGHYNASTGFTCTDYYIKTPILKDSDMKNFINMHADMLINPTFSEEMLTKEKGPVISEIQMLSDNPYNTSTNTVIKNLFGIKSNSADLIGGSVENISNLTREDVVNFYQQNYNPKTALTVVVGDIDEKETMNLLAENFKDFKAPESFNQSFETLNPITKSIRQDLYSSNTDSSIIQMALAGGTNAKERCAISLLLFALCGYKNGSLSEAMKKLNLGISSTTEKVGIKSTDPDAIIFSTSCPDKQTEDVLKLMYQKIHEMAYTPLKKEELDLIKKMIQNNYNYAAESNMSIASIMGKEYLEYGNFNDLKEHEKTLNSITAEDIMNAAKKFLDLNKTSICVVHPKKKQDISFSGTTKTNYDMKTYKTSNNATISTLNSANSKLFSVNFTLNSSVPEHKAGLNIILENMLMNGTSLMPEKEFNETIYQNNIVRDCYATKGKMTFKYSFPKESINTVLDVFQKNAYALALTKENFEKAKQKIKNMYYSLPKNALDRGVEALFEGSEKSFSLRKIIENLDNISYEDVVDFHNKKTQNAQLTISLTGNLKDDSVLKTIYSTISQNGINYNPNNLTVSCPIKELKSNTIVTDTQERNQADIIQMYKIITNGNIKDEATLSLLNQILGGNSNSRLFTDLREKQKLAYRVNSSFNINSENQGQLMLRIFTTTDNKSNPKQSENLQKAIDGFNNHIKKLVEEKVSIEELEAAKLQEKSNMLFDEESTNAKNSLLTVSMNSPYKHDYRKALLQAIDEVTPEDIQAVAKYYLTKPCVTSIVASKKTIEENKEYLSKLGELKSY